MKYLNVLALAALLALIVMLAVPAQAADWDRYDNARFGYSVAIPPEFRGKGESDNGDGQVFASANGRESLAVWGGLVSEVDFEAEVGARIGYDRDDGWTISYQAVTPTWASYSGSQSDTVRYVRMVSLCDGTAFAAFTLDYPRVDLKRFDPIVKRLVGSLTGPRSC